MKSTRPSLSWSEDAEGNKILSVMGRIIVYRDGYYSVAHQCTRVRIGGYGNVELDPEYEPRKYYGPYGLLALEIVND